MNTYFWLIIAIVVFDFIFENILKILNLKSLTSKIPEKLNDIYDPEQYKNSQLYTKTNLKFSLFKSFFTTSVLIILLFLGFFGKLDSFIRLYIHNEILVSLTFFFIIYTLNTILNIPFAYYDVFYIEEKFGFNRSTKKLFFSDLIKSYFLTLIIGALLLTPIIYLYLKFGKNFWYFALGIILFFSIFFQIFYTTLIVPIFNKLSPLEDENLKNQIKKLAEKVGFKLKDIKIIDASKRSTKANAYFSGLGPKKNIILFDTLLSKLTQNEILAVLAHEIGHYKKKHILILLILGTLITALELYIFTLFIDNQQLSQALFAQQNSFHISITAFAIIFTPISTILGILSNIISRSFEYQADRFAAKLNLANDLISALKKLHKENLSNLTPHKAYVFVHYSHPTLLQRIEKLEKFSGT